MKVHISTDSQRTEIRFVMSSQSRLVRIVRLFKHWRQPQRIPGLLRGAFLVRDDFDDYLPADFLIKESVRESTP